MENKAIPAPVVLSCDDDPDAHFLLKRAFLKAGSKCKLVHAYSGAECLLYLEGKGDFEDRSRFPFPELLLLDLKMPALSGFEVLQQIRSLPRWKNLQVVVFSSSDDEGDLSRVSHLGGNGYIRKPADFDKLVFLVEALEGKFFGSGKISEEQRFDQLNILPQKHDALLKVIKKEPSSPLISADTPEIFKLLVDQVKDYAIFLLDLEGRVVSWNEGARRIKGYEGSEIIGKHFSTFYPPQDVDTEKPTLELKLATEMGRYEEEGWRVKKDGSRFWAHVVVTPIRALNGEITGFAKVTHDLTPRKFQEENNQRLLESEERFRLLVEQVKDYGIFILDAKGVITTWNEGARRIKGYNADEIIGKHFSIFYTSPDLADEKPARELSIAVRDGRYEEEGWRVRKDGTRFWANVVITSIWDKRGNLTGFAKVTRDLTQRKQEEDLLRQKTEELGAFAHTLSHDLRSPLRSISSFARLLQSDFKELSEEEKSALLGKIIRSAQAMDSLINEVLILSQLGGTINPDEEVNLDDVIAESITMQEVEIVRTKAVVDVKKPLPIVRANRTLMIQIFSNLISNALKFVPKGQNPLVKIYAIQQNSKCNIHVEDSGIGIPEELLSSIFTIFDRGNVGKEISGNGIGLAIVKKAANKMNADISVVSKLGKGCDFILSIPCRPE